jgi:hypothetical protein
MSVSSYLGSRALPMWAIFEGSFVDNGTCLLSLSSDWMEFNEREFLFGIQSVAYVGNLQRFLRR